MIEDKLSRQDQIASLMLINHRMETWQFLRMLAAHFPDATAEKLAKAHARRGEIAAENFQRVVEHLTISPANYAARQEIRAATATRRSSDP